MSRALKKKDKYEGIGLTPAQIEALQKRDKTEALGAPLVASINRYRNEQTDDNMVAVVNALNALAEAAGASHAWNCNTQAQSSPKKR